VIKGFDESDFRWIVSMNPKPNIFITDDDIKIIREYHVESICNRSRSCGV
jgi:hypothetical protein